MTRRAHKSKKPGSVPKKPVVQDEDGISKERAARFTWQPDDIVFVDPEVQKAYAAATSVDGEGDKKPDNKE